MIHVVRPTTTCQTTCRKRQKLIPARRTEPPTARRPSRDPATGGDVHVVPRRADRRGETRSDVSDSTSRSPHPTQSQPARSASPDSQSLSHRQLDRTQRSRTRSRVLGRRADRWDTYTGFSGVDLLRNPIPWPPCNLGLRVTGRLVHGTVHVLM